MPLQDITITSSINSLVTQSYGQRTYIASTDDQSFPIEEITGSYAGAWPDFKFRGLNSTNSASNSTTNLVVNVTQSWSDSNVTPLGIIPFIHDTMEEFVNGEFSGSVILVSDGNLTDEDCQQLLEVNAVSSDYSFFPYGTSYNDGVKNNNEDLEPEFLNSYTVPRNGEILFHYNRDFITSPSSTKTYIDYIKISRIDQNGNNNSPSLASLNKIAWLDPTAGQINLNVTPFAAFQTYFFYQVTSPVWINLPFFADDNVLDYTLEATSSWTTLSLGYNYLTSSWTASIDTAGGFNTSNGQYVFPLTPNCEIQLSASMSVTVSTSCSLSLYINQYNPVFPINALNASPVILNTYILEPGVTHSLSITSSLYDPIQTYRYEIDALVEAVGDSNLNEILNTNIYSIFGGNDQNSEFQNLPTASYSVINLTEWVSIVQDGNYSPPTYSSPAPNGWNSFQFIEHDITGNPIYTEASGAVLLENNPSNVGTILTLRFNGSNRPWDLTGTPYLFKVTIPSVFTSSGNISQGTNISYGPPLLDLTCSLNDINDIENSFGFIGYIPPNTPGDFYFSFAPTNGQQTLHIIAPSGSGFWDGSVYQDGYFPMISKTEISSDLTASIHGLSFDITQSQSPQTSTSSILVLEPYLTSDYTYDDCNVLLNNFSQNEISGKVRRVLYDNGGLIPSNIEQIISGTAEFAEVNDYLYNASANILPRYQGVRTTSPGFNLPAVNGFNSTELSNVDATTISTNSDPNVEQTTTYFAYFNDFKANWPIYRGTTSPIIKYLIREDGKTFSPSVNNETYYNLVGSFPRDTKAYANLLNDTSPTFNESQSIKLSGESYTPILYTISASSANVATFTNIINFTDLQGISNTVSVTHSLKVQSNPNDPIPVVTNTLINLFSDGISNSNFYVEGGTWGGTGSPTMPSYSFGGIPDTLVRVEVKLGQVRIQPASGLSGGYFRLILWRQNGLNTVPLSQWTSPFLNTSPNFWTLAPNNNGINHIFQPTTGDTIYVTAQLLNDSFAVGYIQNYIMKVSTLGVALPAVTSSFWTTGSANSTTLTSSIALGAALQGNYKQVDIPNSGFDPIELPCEIQVGDEIRFEYDEIYSYRIIDVNSTGSNFIQTILTVDRPIPSIPSLNINRFIIRRKIPDAITGIALDATLFTPISDGFLLPEYPSQTIKSEYSNIVQDLINKSVI